MSVTGMGVCPVFSISQRLRLIALQIAATLYPFSRDNMKALHAHIQTIPLDVQSGCLPFNQRYREDHLCGCYNPIQ